MKVDSLIDFKSRHFKLWQQLQFSTFTTSCCSRGRHTLQCGSALNHYGTRTPKLEKCKPSQVWILCIKLEPHLIAASRTPSWSHWLRQ